MLLYCYAIFLLLWGANLYLCKKYYNECKDEDSIYCHISGVVVGGAVADGIAGR